MLRVKISLAALLLAVVALLSGCGGGGGASSLPLNLVTTRQDAEGDGAWTILVYLDADNDLETAGIRNFNQMETVGSTKDVRIVVQIDRHPAYDTTNGDWTDTRRYLITHDNDTSTMHSIRLDADSPLGELNMGSPNTLKDFVEWGTATFPAQHYCLIIWDHGTGWSIRSLNSGPTTRYIASDDTNAGGLNVNQIPYALANARMDVIAFDACLMQQLETAYELRNSASYLVASPDTEPSPGYDYGAWLREVNVNTTPDNLCRILVNKFANAYPEGHKHITQSALDLSKVGALASAADQYALMLLEQYPSHSATVGYSWWGSLTYSNTSKDLIDYVETTSAALGAEAYSARDAVKSALSDALIAEIHNSDTPDAHGIGIYATPHYNYDPRYSQLQFAQDTHWDECLSVQ